MTIASPSIRGAAVAASLVAALSTPALADSVLRVKPHADLKVLDPNQTTATITIMHAMSIYDMLFAQNEKLDIKPQMVETVNISQDTLTHTYTLRAGLKFHDGTPVTTKDVIPSLNRWMIKDPIGQKLKTFIASMEASDDKTFTIKLKEPYGLVEWSMGVVAGISAFIFPESVAKTDPAQPFTEANGSGPFKFNKAEWVPGSKVVYEKNKDYVPRSEPADGHSGGKIVKVDRVEYKVIGDDATAVAALNAGEIDLHDQPPIDMVPLVEKNPDVAMMVVTPIPAVGVVRPNHLYPPFNNLKARQALQMMITQTDYLQSGFGDKKFWSVCYSYFVCGGPYGTEAGSEIYKQGGDVAKAKQLMAESGYKGEKVVIIATNEIPSLFAMANVTTEKLKQIGVNVDMQISDWGGVVTRRAKKDDPYQGGWHIFHTTWGGLSMSHPLSNVAVNEQCGGNNWFGWSCDEEASGLLDKFIRAPEPAQQKQLAEAYHKRLFEVQPLALTGQYSQPTFYRKNVEGLLKATVIVFWNVSKKG